MTSFLECMESFMGNTILTFLLILFFSVHSNSNYLKSSKNNYIEIGTGATQFGFAEDYLSEYNVDPSPNLKLLFGGRIGKSPNAWFELGYNYNGAFITENTETDFNGQTDVTEVDRDKFSSQSISLGLRLTTNPYRTLSSFIRLGGGQMYTHIRNTSTYSFADDTPNSRSESFEEYKETFLYGALGAGIQMNRYNRISIEVQQNQYSLENVDFEDNLLSLSWIKFL